jgi:hypothetical protein
MKVVDGFIAHKAESEYDFTYDIEHAIAKASMNGVSDETIASFLLCRGNNINNELWAVDDGD